MSEAAGSCSVAPTPRHGADASVDGMILAAAPVGMVVHAADGRIIVCNVAAERLLGLHESQIVGRDSLDPRWRTIHEDGSEFPGDSHPAMVALRTGDPVVDVVMGVHKPDGELSWLLVNALPVANVLPAATDPAASAPVVVVTFADITEQIRARNAAREAETHSRLLAANASDVVFTSDVNRRVTWIAPTVTRVLGYEPAELIGTRMADLWRPGAREATEADRLALYLGEKPRPEGGYLFEMRAKSGEYRWMSGNAHPLLDSMGHPMGAVSGLRDVTDLVLANQRREAVLHTMLDYHALLAPVRDEAGHLVDLIIDDINDSACERFGRNRSELVGTPLSALFPGVGGERIRALCEPVLVTGRPLRLDHARMGSALFDEPRWFDVRGVKVSEQVSLTWRDVTDDYELRLRVEESEARFRLMAENATDIVFHSVDGVTEWVSPSLTTVAGWLPEEIIGGTTTHLWHPDDRDKAIALRDSVYAGATGQETLRYRTKSGDYVWLDVALQPFLEPDGRTGATGIMRDVTDRVLAEQRLVESEARFRMLADSSTDVVYQNDLAGRIKWISSGARDTLGWEPDDLVGKRCFDLVHPDDLAQLLLMRQAVLSEGHTARESIRFRTRSGAYRWMSLHAQPARDRDGNITGLVVGLRDVHEERVARQELSFLAYHDPLTGLRNRAWILDILDTDLAAARRDGTQVAVMFLDLDNFKVVNDSLGHVVGDQVLVAAAHRITGALRPGDRVGRFGGDEFIIIAPGVQRRAEVEMIAGRLAASVTEEVSLDGQPVTVSSSIGIAVSDPESTSTSLLRDADSALFRAKAAGRARWEFAGAGTHAAAMTRLVTEAELRTAIAAHQLVVHYQPIVALTDGSVVGYEALVRWNHPERGVVAPREFLPVAEESGLIVQVGDQVLAQVCAMLHDHPDLAGPISVNQSPVQIGRPQWHDRFLTQVRDNGIDPHRIIIEVTETAIMPILDHTREDLADLRDRGVGIHVDDFGTGYSSIALLLDLPVTGLKLDLGFTGQLTTHPKARALAAGLAGLVEGLGLEGIAEGIETAEQAAILGQQGWTHGQGHYFGRPQPMPPASTPSIGKPRQRPGPAGPPRAPGSRPRSSAS